MNCTEWALHRLRFGYQSKKITIEFPGNDDVLIKMGDFMYNGSAVTTEEALMLFIEYCAREEERKVRPL